MLQKAKDSVEIKGHDQWPLCYGSFKRGQVGPVDLLFPSPRPTLGPLVFLSDMGFCVYSFYNSFVFNLQSNPEKSLGGANHSLLFFELIIFHCLRKVCICLVNSCPCTSLFLLILCNIAQAINQSVWLQGHTMPFKVL